MNIRVMIAEDEKFAREELQYLLEKEKDVTLLPSAANGRELLELVDKYQPQVIFLDMQMPEMEGIEAARKLALLDPPPILVFSTAYDHYALEAFQLNAVDYLLKPFDEKRMKETLIRIRNRLVLDDNKMKKEPPKIEKLLIDDGERFFVVDPASIFYAEREGRGIHIHTATQVLTSKMTLQQLEEKLLSFAFFRTHRSYLVNIHFVDEIIPWFHGAYNIILKDGKKTQIPVSRSSAKDLFTLLKS